MTPIQLSEKREQSRQAKARAELRRSLYAALDGMTEDVLLDLIHDATAMLDQDPIYDWMTELKLKWVPYIAQLHDQADLAEFVQEFLGETVVCSETYPDLDLYALVYAMYGPCSLDPSYKPHQLRKLALELVCADWEDGDAVLAKAREIAKLLA